MGRNKWSGIEAKMKRKKNESQEAYEKRLGDAKKQYHSAAKYIQKYKAEKEAHEQDVARMQKKVQDDKERADELYSKEMEKLRDAEKKLAKEQERRAKADKKAEKYKGIMK